MSNVQSTGGTSASEAFAALNGNAKTTTKASTAEEAQDRFLKLLVTQLKNQDPLNPLDNAQVTSQLAQISTVSGLDKLNSTLSSLFDIYDTGQSMQAAGMIGKLVLVPGEQMALTEGVAVGGVDLAAAAGKVMVNVKDAAGKTVYSEDLGARKAGSFAFVWDGSTDAGAKAPDGNYSFSIEASSGSDAVTVQALQAGTVNAVVRGKTGFSLDLGTAGQVSYSDVKQIL